MVGFIVEYFPVNNSVAMIKKILLVFFSIFVSFLGIDYFFYKLIPKTCTTVQPDKLVHHSLIPNIVCKKETAEFQVEYKVNSLGLRDEEFLATKQKDEYRILFLGDSFTEGSGVNLNQTFVKEVEKKLKGSTERNIRAVNAGVSAYSPLLEWLYLRDRGINLNPDLVVVNLFMNDFNDDRSNLQKAHYNEKGEITGVYVELKQHLPSWLTSYLEGRSASYYLFKKYERQLWKTKGKIVAWFKHQPAPDYTKSGVEFEPGNPDQDLFAITREIPEEIFNGLFEPTANIILQMKSFLDGRNIPMVLAVIPSGHQVADNQWVEGRKELHIGDEKFPDTIFIRLQKFAKENKILSFNPTNDLRNYVRKNIKAKLYFDTDGHFSSLGHEVYGGLLGKFIDTKYGKL